MEVWVSLGDFVTISSFDVVPLGWRYVPIALVLFLLLRKLMVQILVEAHQNIPNAVFLLRNGAREVCRVLIGLVEITIVKTIERDPRFLQRLIHTVLINLRVLVQVDVSMVVNRFTMVQIHLYLS